MKKSVFFHILFLIIFLLNALFLVGMVGLGVEETLYSSFYFPFSRPLCAVLTVLLGLLTGVLYLKTQKNLARMGILFLFFLLFFILECFVGEKQGIPFVFVGVNTFCLAYWILFLFQNKTQLLTKKFIILGIGQTIVIAFALLLFSLFRGNFSCLFVGIYGVNLVAILTAD